MHDLAHAAIDDAERGMIEELIERLCRDLGDELVAVWLYGSRARGERHEESDIDLLVLTKSNGIKHGMTVAAAATDIELAHSRYDLAAMPMDIDWLRQRREIRSFFIQEVDRDKVVLYGRDL